MSVESKKPRVDGPDNTKLWALTNAFCKEWEKNTDALGARNILAAFYLLCLVAQNSVGIFPADESWFEYTGRFLALYVRDTNTETKERVRLSPFVTKLLESKAALKNKVTVRTLTEEAGPAGWAEMINADCDKATKTKVPEIVSARDLTDPHLELVVMAAEHIKGHWANAFHNTVTGHPFYGTGEGAAVGKCNLMSHRDFETSGDGCLYWEGRYCDVVLLPTTRGEPNQPKVRTTIYAIVVLPKGEDNKPTDPEMMAKAAEEIQNNLLALRAVVEKNVRSRVMLEMPRIKQKMTPVDITTDCRKIFPKALMGVGMIKGVTQVEETTTGLGWVDSPMEVAAVYHATFLQVHETGFEAAAATAIVCFRSLGADDPRAIKFVTCTRGFLFYLAEMGPQPHVLYLSRVLDDTGLKDAPKAAEVAAGTICEDAYKSPDE
jgi:serine protease inhibitor